MNHVCSRRVRTFAIEFAATADGSVALELKGRAEAGAQAVAVV